MLCQMKIIPKTFAYRNFWFCFPITILQISRKKNSHPNFQAITYSIKVRKMLYNKKIIDLKMFLKKIPSKQKKFN